MNVQPSSLVCAECGAVSDDQARGWQALLGGLDGNPDDSVEVWVFCPECAAREFDSG